MTNGLLTSTSLLSTPRRPTCLTPWPDRQTTHGQDTACDDNMTIDIRFWCKADTARYIFLLHKLALSSQAQQLEEEEKAVVNVIIVAAAVAVTTTAVFMNYGTMVCSGGPRGQGGMQVSKELSRRSKP